jgi:Ala-tRNA(Pro) deacylase
MRIANFLTECHIPFEVLPHPPAFTAQRLARYLHVKGSQVAKGVLLRGPDGLVLAVLPATHQIDLAGLGRELGGTVALADEADIADVFNDCEWGVVPAFGRLYGLKTLLDESLAPEALIVLDAHTHVEALRLRCGDFERLEAPRRLRFARKAV